MISVVYVYLSKPDSRKDDVKKRAGVTILLMNVAYVITITSMLFNLLQRQVFKQFVNFVAISFVFIPILTSALNPIILFTRVQKIRQTFYSLIRSCFKMRIGRITPVVTNQEQSSDCNFANGVTVTETAQ